jgi:hypothetical protein
MLSTTARTNTALSTPTLTILTLDAEYCGAECRVFYCFAERHYYYCYAVVASFSLQEGQNWGNYTQVLDIQAETCDIFPFFNHI